MIPTGTNNRPRHDLGAAENVARNVTMSSIEIAELTGKEHKNVIRDIRAMRGELEKDGSDLSHDIREELDARGYAVCIHLTREMTELLLTGYSVSLRLKVIRRLNELEAKQAPRVPQTLAEALRLAADQAERIEQQQAALAIAAPKAAFVDQYVENSGSMSFRQAAKLLKANERRFRQLLLDKGVMYYLGGTLAPYQHHIDAGRFHVKTGTSERNQHAFTQARFTPKGMQWVAGLWAAYQLEAAA
ncbi:phage antirepressor KilAC domain-containing protein [Pseudomonas sp. MAP12]|uniref:Phage antirepressor KilAC domain-containing protein n=1 Tax=Geopseudomonas aromaticivorans TaxID=2849492 RepID=A0ABS6MTA0_9GAMM|nr:phage antirepressor KilAC domain-containing protein [Pseudomonas aromaticivorans]MBV2132029.1 phage antirepressor KilAC domain-containing protein [Pseudomonas aromaticivorans]